MDSALSYSPCFLCPRMCGARRDMGERGVCGEGSALRIALTMLHRWEEPCISGPGGSGAVFFTGCTLKCPFCQNMRVSRGELGRTVSEEELAEIFCSLQREGADNINLVTPTHFTPQIVSVVALAKEKGLSLPIIFNTSGYERPRTISALEGTADIFLTDMKFHSPELAASLCGAGDYPAVALEALEEMLRLVGEPQLSESGMLQKGVVVRILILPGYVSDGKAILRTLFERFGNRILYSIMSQYTPPARGIPGHPSLSRTLSRRGYDSVVQTALSLGIENAYIQGGAAASESFIPAFGEGARG
ncbi:MAG: radical SAM protein [Oscillospiraceae bacterium]|nr:radical SAM protein [Oscillospiraceae bacterium]